MKKIKVLLSTFLICLISHTTVAQGCSDAGFCSIGNTFKESTSDIKNSVEFGAIYGIGEGDVKNYSQYLIYTRNFSQRFGLSTKITMAEAHGSFGTRGNLGDVFITGNYNLNTPEDGKLKWSALLGVKIPLTQSNDKINNVSLPMPYQSSLGTFDILSGVTIANTNWDFNVAYQIPLNDNKNSYVKEFSPSADFVSTNFFKRKSDGLFRAMYKLKTANQKFSFKPNLLFIYHFGNDSYQNIFGTRQEIENSKGLTLNGNLIVVYKLSKNAYLESSIAAPFVVREVRPDGLTRAFTFGLSYKKGF